MARYYNMTYRFTKACIELDNLFSESRSAVHVQWYKTRINTFWGLQNWKSAERECKIGMKIAKKKNDKQHAAELLKMLKALRKRKAYPQKQLELAEKKVDTKLYRTMKNFIRDRACAVCGEREGKLMQCGGCKSVWYCSRKHQKKHWKSEHKNVCGKTICTCTEVPV